MAVKRKSEPEADVITIRFDAFGKHGEFKLFFHIEIERDADSRERIKAAAKRARKMNKSAKYQWLSGEDRLFFVSKKGSRTLHPVYKQK